MEYPRFLLTAGASGSGKTLITCGILQAFCSRGLNTVSFKCGPDYIDPMFHSRVIGTKSRNLDTFFTDEDTTRYLLAKNAKGADISVIEGVMGYYDGLGGVSEKASAYDLARVTGTPAVLIVNGKGMSLSILAYIKGFLELYPDSRIQGVILNQVSPMLYPKLAELIVQRLGIAVYGYVPVMKELHLESRHLGLVLPEEIKDLKNSLNQLAEVLEKTLDLDGLLELAHRAEAFEPKVPEFLRDPLVPAREEKDGSFEAVQVKEESDSPVIAVARDEAFCFFYEDNLELLRQMGARLTFFSPLRDKKLPKADGLLLCGGYPELHAKQLSENKTMRESIQRAVRDGLPCMAECGGFMYLLEEMEDMEGVLWPMAGALSGSAYRTEKLSRFGYISLTPQKDTMLGTDAGTIKGHEFHYFDSTCCGDSFLATKPVGKRSWPCIRGNDTCIAGFPHLYYYSNPEVPRRFLKKCREARSLC
ncbi:MAG: cobyrinate a,c-diamide synthase [Lachnospiraceae bacterium]|nr:cobyrinate a,c-diamide synthase [Lachnospiraceae bacterium]